MSPAAPRIVQLLASPITRYVGRPADGPLPAPPGELVDRIQLRAGLGIVGDRYFNRPAHRDASVTIMAAESLPPGADLVQARRNILIAGFAVDAAGRPADAATRSFGEAGPTARSVGKAGPTARPVSEAGPAGRPASEAGPAGRPAGEAGPAGWVLDDVVIRTIDDLVGSVLTLDTGDGPVRFQVRRRANPCAWMDATIGPGAFKALRRKGGIRCTPLDDGVLRIGPVRVAVQLST